MYVFDRFQRRTLGGNPIVSRNTVSPFHSLKNSLPAVRSAAFFFGRRSVPVDEAHLHRIGFFHSSPAPGTHAGAVVRVFWVSHRRGGNPNVSRTGRTIRVSTPSGIRSTAPRGQRSRRQTTRAKARKGISRRKGKVARKNTINDVRHGQSPREDLTARGFMC